MAEINETRKKANIAFERLSLKKNAIAGAAIVAGLLIAYFSFNPLLSYLLGNDRTRPQDYSVYEDEGEFDEIPLDPTSFLLGLDIGDIPPELLAALILYMTNPSRFNPEMLEQFMNNEALRNQVVFRVYDYEDFNFIPKNDMWWRHAAYDTFEGTTWSQADQSVDIKSKSNMPTYSDAGNWGYGPNFLVKMGIDTAEPADLQIPTLHPGPYVIGESILTSPSNLIDNVQSKEDAYDDLALALSFTGVTDATNLTYRTFTTDATPDDDYLADHAVAPNEIPGGTQDLLENYYQFPEGKATYYSSHPNFAAKVDEIVADNWLTDMTNMYQIAMDIARYMKSSGAFADWVVEIDHDRGDDMVETFCATGLGTPMDWSAAFTMFCRYFDIPCRWVSGYDSSYISEVFDQVEGKNMLEYKYMNMYAWAEPAIYLDTAEFHWINFDVPKMTDFPSAVRNLAILINGQPAPAGSNPMRFNTTPGDNSITVSAFFTRGEQPVAGKTVELRRIAPDGSVTVVASADTNEIGYVTFPADIVQNSWVMGPHAYNVRVGTEATNGTFVYIEKPYQLYVDPNVVSSYRPVDGYPVINNTSPSHNDTFNFWGNLVDTAALVNVPSAQVQLRLYNQGMWDWSSYLAEGLGSPSVFSTGTGYSFTDVGIWDDADTGKYNLTARLTGNFNVSILRPYVPAYLSDLLDCSTHLSAETDPDLGPIYINEPHYWVSFYVEGEDNAADTVVNPAVLTNLKVYHYQGDLLEKGSQVELNVMNFDGSPLAPFYTGNTDPGTGLLNYNHMFSLPVGVYLLRARATASLAENYSYIVMNGSISFVDTIAPPVQGINQTVPDGVGSPYFDFGGNLATPGSGSIRFGQVDLLMWDGGWDKPISNLDLNQHLNYSSDTGIWYFDDNSYTGDIGYLNISARFNGNIRVANPVNALKPRGNQVLNISNLGVIISNANTTLFDLPVDDPSEENLNLVTFVNSNPYYHSNIPNIGVQNGDTLSFGIRYTKGLNKPSYISNVQFDLVFLALNGTQTSQGSQPTNLLGEASWNVIPNTIASGPYLVQVNSTNLFVHDGGENFTIFTKQGYTHFEILDVIAPYPYMLRGSEQEGFSSYGKVMFDNGWYASRVNLNVRLYNGSTDYSAFYYGGVGASAAVSNNTGGIVFGDPIKKTVQDTTSLPAQYYKLVYTFNGSFNTLGWSGYDANLVSFPAVNNRITASFQYGTGMTWNNFTSSTELILINDPQYYAYTKINGIDARVGNAGTPTSPIYFADYATGVTPVSINLDGSTGLIFNIYAIRGLWNLTSTTVEVRDPANGISRTGLTNGLAIASISFTPAEISNWRVGPHYFEIGIHDPSYFTVNYTIVLVNGTSDLFSASVSGGSSFTRGVDSIGVIGSISYNGNPIRAAKITVSLFTLDYSLVTSTTAYTNNNGAYSTSLLPAYSVIQGEYIVRADFNFTFYNISTNNYKLNLNYLQPAGAGYNSSSSATTNVNVTATTRLQNLQYNPNSPVAYIDTVQVTGRVDWRNGTSSYNGINFGNHPELAQYVIVKVYDGTSSLIHIANAGQGGNVVNNDGTFQVNIFWIWSGDFSVEVEFNPPVGVYNIEGVIPQEAT